jgi:chromosome segregation ATPase
MAEDELTELVKRLRSHASVSKGMDTFISESLTKAADAIERLRASLANAEDRFDASEARNEFLTSVIEDIEQAAKEAKELPK